MASSISVTLVWCYESQSRQLRNEGGKNFSTLRMDRMLLYTSIHYPKAVPVPLQNCFLQACTLWAPPFNVPRSTPDTWPTTWGHPTNYADLHKAYSVYAYS